MSGKGGHSYEFGEFRLDGDKHVLWRGDQIVPITPRAAGLLLALIERRGDLVEREELLSTVWRDAFVEEANLNFTISNLRKVLGPDGKKCIQTVPRRGYRFTATVKEVNRPGLVLETHTVSQVRVEEDETVYEISPTRLSTSHGYLIAASGILLVSLALGLFWFRYPAVSGSLAEGAGAKSVSVLPLRSFGRTPEEEALGFGVTDALVTSLGRLEDVRIIRATTDADGRAEPGEIGRLVGADSVLDGTLQRVNGKLRVTLRLIRSADGIQLWSRSFDEDEAEIFRLQDALAGETALALSRQLGHRAARRPTNSHDAYQAYLRGRFFFDKRTRENYEKALAEFERAVALDPGFALAHSGLADTYAMQANISFGEKRDALYQKSRSLAIRALEIDETSAEAHASLGWVKRVYDWDWAGSEAEFKRAVELDPNYVNARQWYAFLLASLGRLDESLIQIEKAREIAPLSKPVMSNYFAVRQLRRDNEVLRPLAEQLASLDESDSPGVRIRSIAYLQNGDYTALIELGEAFRKRNEEKVPYDYLAANMAIAYARTGHMKKSEEMLSYLSERADSNMESAYRLAQAYAELGREAAALGMLKRCFAARDDRLVWLKVETYFDKLRNHPQFNEILARMKL